MTNAEVDQSIKIDDLARDTVLAIADGISYAIVIPAGVKRAVMQRLRAKGKSHTAVAIYAFAIGLYFLLRDIIRQVNQIVIDVEYTGREAEIKIRWSLICGGMYRILIRHVFCFDILASDLQPIISRLRLRGIGKYRTNESVK